MNTMRRSTFLIALLLTALVATALWAQVDTATIVGTIHDTSGAVIPSAAVTVTETNTNIKTSAKTDAEGNYVVTPLKVGTYSVTVDVPGFKTEIRQNIVLRVQDRIRVDFEMQVGATSESVMVSAETPMVQTETSSLGEVVDARQVVDLPLNGRNYLQLATLTAGVSTTTGNDGAVGGTFVSNGTRSVLNNYLVDGIDNNSNDNGGTVLRTNVDAIQEFKVQTGTYSAEFGRAGGAAINVSIKSGTNQLHGSAYEFVRNSALDARGYFEDRTQPRVPLRLNQFGGTLGGPIKKDKTFVFGDFESYRSSTGLTYTSSVPTDLMRQGDFSELLPDTVLYDPATYDPDTNTRQPFSGNIIPSDRITDIGQAFINLYPSPNQPGKLKNNYIRSPGLKDVFNQFDVRLDYNISSADQLFGRFSLSQGTRNQGKALPGLADGAASHRGGLNYANARGAVLGFTHTFSPTMVNEVRVGFNRMHERRGIPPGGAQAPPPELTIPGVPDNAQTHGVAVLAPSGYRSLGWTGTSPTFIVTQEFQLSDTLNVIRGKHTVKTGIQFRRSQFNLFQVSAPRGRFGFNGRFTRDPATASGGNSLADLLLDLPNSATLSALTWVRNRQHVYGAFVQDDFKVSSRLTLNLGLRYDYTTPIVQAHDTQSNFDYATGELVVANQNGASRGLTEVDKLDFAPRVGFAFSPFSNHKTAIRGGYGVFYSAQEIRTGDPLQLAYNLPFFFSGTFISDNITPVRTLATGFPPLDPSQAAAFPNVTSEDWRLKTPYFQEWSFTVQHELPASVLLEAGYVGTKGTHLQVTTDRNQVRTPGPADVQPRRPYPNYGAFTSIENHGNSTYHSLQVKATKRLSYGLMFLSAFTWSRAFTDQPEICCGNIIPQNSYDLRAEKGPADFDQRFRWVTSFDYELPLGKGRRYLSTSRAADLILGGWHLGGIVSFSSGLPFSPLVAYDPSNTGSQGFMRADRIGNGVLPSSQRTIDNWFDLNAFALPADYTFGNAGKNFLTGPGSRMADISVRKQFLLTESKRLEFRAEFFNFANHPVFAQPDNYIDDGPGAAAVITDTAIAMRQIQFALKFLF